MDVLKTDVQILETSEVDEQQTSYTCISDKVSEDVLTNDCLANWTCDFNLNSSLDLSSLEFDQGNVVFPVHEYLNDVHVIVDLVIIE